MVSNYTAHASAGRVTRLTRLTPPPASSTGMMYDGMTRYDGWGDGMIDKVTWLPGLTTAIHVIASLFSNTLTDFNVTLDFNVTIHVTQL